MFGIHTRATARLALGVGIALASVGLLALPQTAAAQPLPPLEIPIEVGPGEDPEEPATPFDDLTADEAKTCLNRNRTELIRLEAKLKATIEAGVLGQGTPNLRQALANGGAPAGELGALNGALRGPLRTNPGILDNSFAPGKANAQQQWAAAALAESERIETRLRTYAQQLDAAGRAAVDPAERQRLANESKLLWDTVLDVSDIADAARSYGACWQRLEAVRDDAAGAGGAGAGGAGAGGAGAGGAGAGGAGAGVNFERFDQVQDDLRHWVESRQAVNSFIDDASAEMTRLRRAESGHRQLARNYTAMDHLEAADRFERSADDAAERYAQLAASRNHLFQLANSMGTRGGSGELAIGIQRLAQLEASGRLPLGGSPSAPGTFTTAPNPWEHSAAAQTMMSATAAHQVVTDWLNSYDGADPLELRVAEVLRDRVSHPGRLSVELTFFGTEGTAPRDATTEALSHVLWWTASRTFDPNFSDADSLNTALSLIDRMSDPSFELPAGGLIFGTATEPPMLGSSPAADTSACVDIPLARLRVSGRTVTFEFDRRAGGFYDDAQVSMGIINQATGEWYRNNTTTTGDSISLRLMPSTEYRYAVGTQCNDGPFGSSESASRGVFVTEG